MNVSRFLAVAAGTGCIIATVAGANKLLVDDAQSKAGGAGAPAAAAPKKNGSTAGIAQGTVTSDPEPVRYYGSPFLPAATVVEVLVKDGQDVTAGTALLRFDDRAAKLDVAKAKAAVQRAVRVYQQVVQKQADHATTIKQAELALKDAEAKLAAANRGTEAAKDAIDRSLDPLKGSEVRPSQTEIDRRRRYDPETIRFESLAASAAIDVEAKKLQLEFAKAQKFDNVLQEAAAASTVADEDQKRAELALGECTLTAKADGVVEQLTAGPGTLVGPQTRTPLLVLVPKGTRLVRAEIWPEFAAKIGDAVGQKVTISDERNTHITYEGTVERVASAFLPKRDGGADLIAGKPQVVLEVFVRVPDPAPAGKPPLRVGQPVRVIFP